MRIVTLNLRHGGGARVPQIGQRLVDDAADLLVLTEYREGARGTELRRLLEARWPHQISTPSRPRQNGLLLASRTPMTRLPSEDLPDGATRWCEVQVDGVRVAGAYLPAVPKALVPFWDRLLTHARPRVPEPWLMIGDLNTGLSGLDASVNIRFSGEPHLRRMLALGYVDAWRSANPDLREYSWFSSVGNGFRIDHAVLSPTLAGRVRSVAYDHSTRERLISDHSLLSIELEAHGEAKSDGVGVERT